MSVLLCIPGPWPDRSDFLKAVITQEPAGRFMYAGAILADLHEKDHVALEFAPMDAHMGHAFETAGQGRLDATTLAQVEQHRSVVYLHLDGDVRDQLGRIGKFTRLLQRVGGVAVKVESAGIAHTWDGWFGRLDGTLFDVYCLMVVLIGGEAWYYSCGMHHFALPECALPRSVPVEEAAELMNQFNFYRIVEAPVLASGHTFSMSAQAPVHELMQMDDQQHEPGDPFFNEHGVWHLLPRA